MSNVPSDELTYDYRREARRLRSRHVGRPEELYRSLCDLSAREDRCRGTFTPIQRVSRRQPATRASRPNRAPSSGFAQLVAQRLGSGVLRYSDRLSLLSIADAIGMGRFQANLVIAAVQHEGGHGVTPAKPRKSRTWLLALVAAVALQSIIIITACIVISGQ